MLNDNKFAKYLLANTLVKFFFALVTATVTLESYKNFDSESLSWLLLAGVAIAGQMNSILTKYFVKIESKARQFVVFEAILVASICLVATLTTPGAFMVATCTVWALTDAVMSSIWENIKQKSGNGRELENRLRAASATGRTAGLIAAIVLANFQIVPDFFTAMIVIASSSWFENYYLREMLD